MQVVFSGMMMYLVKLWSLGSAKNQKPRTLSALALFEALQAADCRRDK